MEGSGWKPLKLSTRIGRSLMEHAERESPRECCGVLSGKDGLIESYHPLPNTSRQPVRHYFAEPRALLSALRDIRERERELLGIYHSHPRSAPEPSPEDIEQAYYPDCAYFIIGAAGFEPRLRAFRIAEGKAESIEFTWADE